VKAKEERNFVEKDGKWICLLCDREFKSKASVGSHLSWHSSGPRSTDHLEYARSCVNKEEQIKSMHKALRKKFEDKEWVEDKYKRTSESIKSSFYFSEENKEVRIVNARKGSDSLWSNPESKDKWMESRFDNQFKQNHYIYNGTHFRSTYEVKFAYILDVLGFNWEYETGYFNYHLYGKERKYLPDFYLPELDIWVEVFGRYTDEKGLKIYLTSKENNITIFATTLDDFHSFELNDQDIIFSQDGEKENFFYANTEPSQIRNYLEGVETRIESLRKYIISRASRFHEQFLVDENYERYSPTLQEIVRNEDKEPHDNINVMYCPYIPLFATPTLITSDLISQKGFLSSAGFKVINAGMFCEGYISGTIS